MRRIWTILPAGFVSLALTACNQPVSTAPATAAVAPAQQVGAPLYAADKPEVIPLPDAIEQTVVIPNAVIRMDKKQVVAAEVDGRIEGVGVMLAAGAQVNPNDRDIFYDPNDKQKVLPYRRLRIGDRVIKGSTVALLNDLDALVQIEQAQNIISASDKAISEATVGANKIEDTLKIIISQGPAGSKLDLLNAEATLARYRENIFTSMREKAKADGDEKRAMILRSKHRSNAAVTGVVTNILREPGETVRAGEPLMEILSLEDIRIEGTMEAHFADTVKPGMKVGIEPTLPVGPDLKSGAIAHRLEVTGVTVTADKQRPLVISSSLDGTATVWDVTPPAGKPKAQTRLNHPVGVRCVTATGAKAGKAMAATGGDDGRIRLWDVSNPDRLPSEPAKEFAEAHSTAVAALAYSPDGRWLVSAAGREIFLWEVGTAKKLFALPGDHKDAVTTVKFTPQGKLVTASRDKTVRVWAIGDKNAAVERTIDHRKANIDAIGVSSGGGRVLFDSDDGRLDVVSLADGQPVGSIQNAAAGARFAGLSLFSPDDAFVLTAGGDGDMRGELQVWVTPKPGGRGAEVRRLVTPYRSMPTCADFGPGFVVVGTQAGGVHLWPVEMLKGAAKERVGRVISVIRADARNVKVRVETSALDGNLGLLQDKSTATLIINPGSEAAPPPALPANPSPRSAQVPLPEVILPVGGLMIPPVSEPQGRK